MVKSEERLWLHSTLDMIWRNGGTSGMTSEGLFQMMGTERA